MNMTNSIQASFLYSGAALPMPPRFEGPRSPFARAPLAAGRFDIHDAEGHAPEFICRVMLGLCLAFAFGQCFLQLAAF